jgi:hypothetical protein
MLNFRKKPKSGGPTFTLLIVWLLGDAGTLARLYIGGGLLTQKFSAIWFAISDILLMAQMRVYRGYFPALAGVARGWKKLMVPSPLSPLALP